MTCIRFFKIILFLPILIFPLLLPPAGGVFAQTAADLTLELKAGTEDDWELRNANGDVLGIVKNRRTGTTFKIYDSRENYNGFVYQSGEWVPRDARQRREFQVSSDDVQLYVNILRAAELDVPEPRRLKATPREGAENEWVLTDPSGNPAGSVTKEEVSFKFYDENEKLMGFINEIGNWLPRLNINRREMRITAEQAQFYLDVLQTVPSIR